MTAEELEAIKAKRQPTETFARIVGYVTPIKQWNPGKAAEYKDRKMFDISV